MSSRAPEDEKLVWENLSFDLRELLKGKLVELWGAPSDAEAFDSLAVDKQQALLLLLQRINAKGLWHAVQRIENVYGEGGVGVGFKAWPMIQTALSRRSDFTRLFARHHDTAAGFYERGRADAVLHFMFKEGNPRRWYVHFDLYSPVYSVASLSRHIRIEVLGKVRPDWRMIRDCLKP